MPPENEKYDNSLPRLLLFISITIITESLNLSDEYGVYITGGGQLDQGSHRVVRDRRREGHAHLVLAVVAVVVIVASSSSLSLEEAELLECLGVESVEVEPVQDVEDALVVVVPPNLI